MRPCQPFPCIARNSMALPGCWMLLVPPNCCSFSASGMVHTPHLRAFLLPFDASDVGRKGWVCMQTCRQNRGKEQASNRKLCHPFAPQGYVYKAFAVGLHETVSHITGTAIPWVTLCCEVLPFLFSAPQQLQKTESKHCTRDFSSSLVIMTIVAVLCSHTILQKSLRVSGSGPCVAM